MPSESLSTKPKELTPEEKEKIKNEALAAMKKKVTIVDATHLAEMEARDAADASMTEKKGKASWFKKIWKHKLFDEYYRQKELNKVRSQIEDTGNIYTAVDLDKKAHDSAMSKIVERFSSEYEEAIDKERGEDKNTLDRKDDETIVIKETIQNLIKRYASGAISPEDFMTEKKIIFKAMDHSLTQDATTYADNLFEIAKNAKLAVQHGAKLSELDLDFDIIVGKAKSSIKTEAKTSWVDRRVENIKKTKVGRFVNPATLSVALGLAYSLGGIFGKKALRSKLATVGSFGATAALSGVLAGIDESQRLTNERRQHGRERAKGGQIEAGDPRREQMEEYAYQTKTAIDLTNDLRSVLFSKDAEGKEVLNEAMSEAEAHRLLAAITNIKARAELSSQRQIDLITYSHESQVEKERTDMDLLLCRAKAELKKQAEGHILKDLLPEGMSVDEYLKQQVETAKDTFLSGEKGITAKDRSFRNLKAKRSIIVGLKSMFIGATVGAAFQEGHALLTGWSAHGTEGVFQGGYHAAMGHDTTHEIQTPLEHIRGWLTGHPSHTGGNIDKVLTVDNHQIHFKLPEGVNVVHHHDGTYDVIQGQGADVRVISHNIKLEFNADGSLKPESVALLGKDGIVANSSHEAIQGRGNTVSHTPEEYVKNHPDTNPRIHRDGFFHHRDPVTGSDEPNSNELRGRLGGLNETGFDANGNFDYEITHMVPEGSYYFDEHGNKVAVDVVKLMHEGKLKFAFSMSRSTEFNPFKGSIDTNGHIQVPKTDDLFKLGMITKGADGIAHTKGYMEVLVSTGIGSDGIEHFREVATEVGPELSGITDSAAGVVMFNHLGVPLETEPPYFIPIIGRNPLEPIVHKKKEQVKVIKMEPREKPADKEVAPGTLEAKKEKKIDPIENAALEQDINTLNARIESIDKATMSEHVHLQKSDLVSTYARAHYDILYPDSLHAVIMMTKDKLEAIRDHIKNYRAETPKDTQMSPDLEAIDIALATADRQLKKAEEAKDKKKISEYKRFIAQISSQKFFIRMEKDSSLKGEYKEKYEHYNALSNYKNLKDTDPLKKKIDKDFEEYKKIAGNENKTINYFIKYSLRKLDDEFAKRLKKLEDEEKKAKVIKVTKKSTTARKVVPPKKVIAKKVA
jgi:hypothetical protein